MNELLKPKYLDTPAQWKALAAHLRAAGEFGLDTEFYGLDVRKESCVAKARVHVWSVATRRRRLDARGYHRCRAWVLPAAALAHRGLLKVLEDPDIRKEVHNQSVDQHALANHDIKLRGARNTLDLIRWTHPHLVNTPGRFSLKALMQSLLLREPVCEFKDVVSDVRTVALTTVKRKVVKVCACGVPKCRARKLPVHAKSEVEEEVSVTKEKLEKFQHPLESIVPGHPRWELLVKYAAEDAVAALQVAELADLQSDPAPFPYTKKGRRPGYAQGVTDSVIAMEATGFPIDTAWAGEMAARAERDEEKELRWLGRWYLANVEDGPRTRANSTPKKKDGIDAIWASPAKKIRLFDDLGFPRSPIWAKGRVKQGKAKVDQTAMVWIARNHPPAAKLMAHLTHLQRIRNGKKYLVKMRDCGGWVHPICGPAGDSDDRAGAVTGRLGIKGTLESQQLPSKEEKDLYQVRKGIAA